jgi:hypothetical protein
VTIVSRLDPSLGCTFVLWHGDVTPAESNENLARVLADPEFPPGPRWLVDMTTAHTDVFDLDAMRDLGERVNAAATQLEGMRLAAIPNGSWDKARHVIDEEIDVPGLVAMQFAGIGTACAWLGLQPAPALAVLSQLRDEARAKPVG